MFLGGQARVPVYTGTAAQMAALTGMATGDIYSTTDTKKVYQYDGANWVDVLSGITNEITLVSQDTITSATSKSYAGLSTSAFRFYKVLIELAADGAGTAEVDIRLNNDSANHYYNRVLTGGGYTDGGATSSFVIATGTGQGTIADITIPVNLQNTACNVIGNTFDTNKPDCFISGTAFLAAAVSRIDVIMSAASSGKITLLGIK